MKLAFDSPSLRRPVVSTAVAWLACCITAEAQYSTTTPNINTLTKAADWVFSLKPVPMQNYLNYPGSNLSELTSVQVSYTPKPRQISNNTPGQHYADFWFHNETVLGSKLFNVVNLQPETTGYIIVQTADSSQSRAVIDTVLRLTLEVDNHMSSVIEVLVPQAIFQQIGTDLNYFHYYSTKTVKQTAQGSTLHIVSYPSKQEQFYYLSSGGGK